MPSSKGGIVRFHLFLENCLTNPALLFADSSAVLEQLKGQEANLVKVKEALKAINYETVLGQVLPQQVKDVIVSMGSALNILLKSRETLTSVLVDAVKVSESNNAGPKQARTLDPKISNKVLPTPIPPEVAAERKVKQALREAEKKTLLFNLNLGNVPTMNKDTLSSKVTLALSSKASEGEHDYDIKDAEETIDDILSCTKLEFLGTKTKQFFNKRNMAHATTPSARCRSGLSSRTRTPALRQRNRSGKSAVLAALSPTPKGSGTSWTR
jgi:hypothetical protein